MNISYLVWFGVMPIMLKIPIACGYTRDNSSTKLLKDGFNFRIFQNGTVAKVMHYISGSKLNQSKMEAINVS